VASPIWPIKRRYPTGLRGETIQTMIRYAHAMPNKTIYYAVARGLVDSVLDWLIQTDKSAAIGYGRLMIEELKRNRVGIAPYRLFIITVKEVAEHK